MKNIKPPKCKSLQHIRKYSNDNYEDITIDNYHWLTDKSNPEVTKYLKQENDYCKSIMSEAKKLQQELFAEIKARIPEDDITAPYLHDNFYYYFKTEKNKEYSIFCRIPYDLFNTTLELEQKEILLDENTLAINHEFLDVADIEVSTCHQYLAYTIDTIGDETYDIYIKNLKNNVTNKLNLENITNIGITQTRPSYRGLTAVTSLDPVVKPRDDGIMCKSCNISISPEIIWSTDSKSIFYVKLDHAHRPYQVYNYNIENNTNILLFTEQDERFEVSIGRSRTNKYIFISAESKISTEIYYLDANTPYLLNNKPNITIKSIKPREQYVEYHVEHYLNQNNNYFYVLLSNNDKNNKKHYKPNYELYKINLDNNDINNWELILKHNNNIKLEHLDCFSDYCILFTKDVSQTGLSKLNIIKNYDFNNIIEIKLNNNSDNIYNIEPDNNIMFHNKYYQFSYESFTEPEAVYNINADNLELKLIKQDKILNNYNKDNYIVERLYISDLKIPVSIIYNKNKYKKNQNSPLLLYGYGSYGISLDPYFSYAKISLLNRGIAYAIAHIRGGGELGENWHDQGRLNNKNNTFNDFITTAEYLIKNNYTSADKLIIQGGSAGGMLIGNVINQRPELFKIAIAEVPFVDCLNTMLNPKLPLTISEYEEWGNPTSNIESYKYIKSYTPYENIKSQDYPSILINNSLNDYRVSYFEAAKWTAKLREFNTNQNNIILLNTNMTAGHHGSSGRYETIKEIVFNYCFILLSLKQS